MVKSIIFDKKNILISSGYKPAIDKDVFIEKLLVLVGYTQEDAYETVVDLGDAEKILMWVQANV